VATLGRYELRDRLGRGGFATVYRAWDPRLHREVALKALQLDLAEDPSIRQRFLAESRALARLQHPNIVVIFDVGDPSERPFFAMELVDGRTLAEVLAGGNRLSAEHTVEIVTHLASALDALHEAGLIHRDVKAANVMLSRSGRVVLMDLGIARAVEGSQYTSRSMLVGTPEAMAPEQIRGGAVGPAVDIYALGVLTYQMLAGRPPFLGDTAYLLYAHAHEAPPPLWELRPGLPTLVYAVVEEALSKDPARRPAGAGVFAAELAEAAGLSVPAPRPSPLRPGPSLDPRGDDTLPAPAPRRAAPAPAAGQPDLGAMPSPAAPPVPAPQARDPRPSPAQPINAGPRPRAHAPSGEHEPGLPLPSADQGEPAAALTAPYPPAPAGPDASASAWSGWAAPAPPPSPRSGQGPAAGGRIVAAVAVWLACVVLVAVIGAAGGLDDSPMPLLVLLPGCAVAGALLPAATARRVVVAGACGMAALFLLLMLILTASGGSGLDSTHRVALLIGILPVAAALLSRKASLPVALGVFAVVAVANLLLIGIVYPRTTSYWAYNRNNVVGWAEFLAAQAALVPALGLLLARGGRALGATAAAVELFSVSCILVVLPLAWTAA
jgi:serine/threonine protein kinase